MAKKINLGIFASDNIQKATLSLLADLGIRMKVRSHQQIPIPVVVAASLGETPNEIQEICSKIAESYLAGIISEKTFAGNDNVVSFEEACENVGRYEQMMVFAVDFKKEAKVSRQDIAKLTRILNRASKSAPVVLVCRYFDDREFKKMLISSLSTLKIPKSTKNVLGVIVGEIIKQYNKYMEGFTRNLYIPKWI